MLKRVTTVALVLASLMTSAGLARAQSSVATKPGFELLVPSGTVVPTGAREDAEVLAHLPWFALVGGALGEIGRAVMMGLAWVLNAIVAEQVIRTRLIAPVSVRPGQARPVLVSTTWGESA